MARVYDRRCRELSARAFIHEPSLESFTVIPALLGYDRRRLDSGLGLVNAKIAELFSEAYKWDPFPTEVLAMLEKEVRNCKEITLSECSQSPTGRLL